MKKFKFKTQSDGMRKAVFTDWADDKVEVSVTTDHVYISVNNGDVVSLKVDEFNKITKKTAKEVERERGKTAR